MPRYDVFLSHASADKPAVEHLARKLREAGLDPFLDKWHLIPGDPWQEALEEALDQSRTCAVFLGKALGPWQNEEMRSALETRVRDAGFRVIPVLLPGGREPGKEELPRFLRRLTWVDFRAGLDDEDAFRRLLAGIKGKPPGPGSGGGGGPHSFLLDGYRCMAPAREPFIQRSEYAKVRDALLAGATVGITTAIHGAGGFGKTALAVELCYDPVVRERYPDGILWTTMGEEIDAAGRLARVRDLIRWWTEKDPPAFETVSAASAHLRQELTGKRVLLGVDDIWRPEDVTPFQGLGPTAALLLTTRDKQILPGGAVPVHVDAMEVPEAVRMLGAGLSDGTGVDLRGVAKRLGEWPLLLKIVNRQLRELIEQDGLSLEQSIREVNEALDAEGLTVFDREDLESRGQAVARTVGASLQRLSGEEVGLFEQLAIFPEDKDVPLRVLEKLWGLGSFAAKKLCGRLHDLSLLLRFDRQSGTMRLHDVIRAYLIQRGGPNLPEWHRCLLDAFRPSGGVWPDLPRGESYLWNHLVHHLIEAGQSDICRALLLDLHYLGAKLNATDVHALVADYSSFAENDGELRLVRDALRLSAHVLGREPRELPGQLWGRLLDRRETGIRSLLLSDECCGVPWLRPREASLTRPGGTLIRTIDHPGSTSALAVLPDGRLASGSKDGVLRVWDVETGRALKVLKGHSAEIRSIAVLDGRRVVTGSTDGMFCVWDLEAEQTTLELPGLPSRFIAMAPLDHHRVIFGTIKRALWIVDVDNGHALPLEMNAEAEDLCALQVFNGGRRAIYGTMGGKLRIIDCETGHVLRRLTSHSAKVNGVGSMNGHFVVSTSDDGRMVIWEADTGIEIRTLEEEASGISAMVVLNDWSAVTGFGCGSFGTAVFWSIQSFRYIPRQ